MGYWRAETCFLDPGKAELDIITSCEGRRANVQLWQGFSFHLFLDVLLLGLSIVGEPPKNST